LEVIKDLIDANSEEKQELGLSLLDAALKTQHLVGLYGFDFGARTRDYGYSPETREEFQEWFGLFVDYTAQLAVSEKPISPRAKTLLAENFWSLWMETPIWNELEAASKLLASRGAWNEGWIAVRTTIRFHAEGMETDLLSRLQKLEGILAPCDLLEQARTYVLSSHSSSLQLFDTEDDSEEEGSDSYSRAARAARTTGQKVASDENVFKALFPDILSIDGPWLYSFAEGLADGCSDISGMWKEFQQQLAAIDTKEHNYQALCGFLHSISSRAPELVETILDEAVTDKVLAPAFPLLQTAVEINAWGLARLNRSLAYGAAPIRMYHHLAGARVHESIDDDDICDLLRLIASKPDGLAVAVKILERRCHRNVEAEEVATDAIKSVGQELLAQISFDHEKNRPYGTNYSLGKIIEACFADEKAKANAEILCKNLAQVFSGFILSSTEYRPVFEALATKQPTAFLDGFLGEVARREQQMARISFSRDIDDASYPLSKIPDEIILDWCNADPAIRYPVVAASIIPDRSTEQDKRIEWAPLASMIITKAPDPIAVLNEFKRSFILMSRVGSRAEIMRKRLSLISDLKNHSDPSVAEWACREEKIFEDAIRSERQRETQREQTENERNERFE